MSWTLRILFAVALLPVAVQAQAVRKRPAPVAVEEQPRKGEAVTTTIGPPSDEAGGRVIQWSNGFLRVHGEDPAPPEGTSEEAEEGGLVVVPAPPAEPVRAPQPQVQAQAVPVAPPAQPTCLSEQRLLAQRLVHLRGIDVEPATALLVLSQLEEPHRPFWMTIPGQPHPVKAGGEILASAVSYDMETRGLAESLAKCLAR